MFTRASRWQLLALVAALMALLATAAVADGRWGGHDGDDDDDDGGKGRVFELHILHNNDAESQLLNAGSGLEDFGGVHRFGGVVRRARIEAAFGSHGAKTASVLLSSGDNFLAGPEFNASLVKGVPYYDAIAMDLLKYDAAIIGNHEFDFGPDVLENFIESFKKRRAAPFLSANLDFSGEPGLQNLVDDGRIAASTIIRTRGEKIGVVGATTENLPFISSPRNVITNAVAPAAQAEINKLISKGIDKIIFVSHLQSIQEDLDLLPLLSGVDVAIAGGGDELLANAGDLLIPGDEGDIYDSYPIWATGGDGANIPVVTTSGAYKYLGRLVVRFDRDGNLIEIDEDKSGPIRVAGGNNPDAVYPNRRIERRVVEPVQEAVDALQSNVIATSQVILDGRRSQIRTVETNQGNLITDAIHWTATTEAPNFGAPVPDVTLGNGGGIRNDSEIPAGDITEFDTFDILPFLNFVSIIPDIPRTQFKEILENAVSRVEFTDGRFAQVSGFTLKWDPAGTPQVLDADGNVTTAGTRVVDVVLDNGTVIVDNGVLQPGADVVIATVDFLARGGDQYPYRGAPFTSVGVTYQQALANYLQGPLGGLVTAGDYPEGGEGRITEGAPTAVIAPEIVSERPASRHEFALLQNTPNPFNPTTTIRFSVPAAEAFTLSVYDVSGAKVREFSGQARVGVNSVTWNGLNQNGSAATSGVYFYTIKAGSFADTKKMMLLK